MKTPISLLYLSFIIGILISCGRNLSYQLDKAECLLCDSPDSALSMLMAIGIQEKASPKDQAKYNLLLNAAWDKNYIDISSDSLISFSVDYYTRKGSHREKMLAWYYHGIVLKNAQNYTQSILSFEKAEIESKNTGDDFYLGLIFRNKADIYNLTNNNAEAIESLIKAVAVFDKVGAMPYRDYATLALAIDYSNNADYSSADSLLSLLLHNSSDSVLLSQCTMRKASNLVKQDQHPETAIALYRSIPHSYFGVLDYSYLAHAFEMIGQRDSSDYWFSKGYSKCRDQLDSTSLDYMKSLVEMTRGHYQEAYHLVNHAATVQDSLSRILLQQSVSGAVRDYYKSETNLREEKIRSMRQRALFGVILGLFIMSILALSLVSLSKKTDQLLKEEMARVALRERELERVNRDNAHLIGSLFSEKINHFDKLSESYFRMEEGKEKEVLFQQIKALATTIRNDDALFLSLEKDLDRYCNGIMSKIRLQVPRIKGENLKIIALFFAGFSYETVKFILNKYSIDSLKTARSRYRKEIKDAHAPDTDFFLKMLEMKKRPQAGTNENLGAC